jgi:hypothetical protein
MSMSMYNIVFMSDVFILWVVLLDVLVCLRILMEKSLCIFLSNGCMFYIYSSFARRISMHKSLNGKELMYISIGWLHDLNANVL